MSAVVEPASGARRDVLLEFLRTNCARRRLTSPETKPVYVSALERLGQRLRCLDDSGPTRRHLHVDADVDPCGVAVPTLVYDRVEIMIVRLLATSDPWQFSVTQRDARVFTGNLNGYHHEQDRVYVTGLSPLLDTAAAFLYSISECHGGRFYVHKGFIRRALDDTSIMRFSITA